MIFDHDRAILGPGEDGVSGADRLEKLADRSILNGCIVDGVCGLERVFDRISDIAAHIRSVASLALPGICSSAERAGAFDRDTREAVEQFLASRAAALVKLMGDLNAPGQRTLG